MSEFYIFDLHNDFLTCNDTSKKQIFSNELQKSGDSFIYALYKGERSLVDIIDIYNKAKQSSVTYFAFEDACYVGENISLELNSKIIAECNPLYVSLTWNNDNAFACGCSDEHGQLKQDGQKFIEYMNDANIAIDIAHANKKSGMEIIDKANRVLCSHTAFLNFCKHKRNIDQEVIKLIIEKNGIIGLSCVGYFLVEKVNDINLKTDFSLMSLATENFFLNLDWFLQKYGCDNIAIGTDFFGSDFILFNENYRTLLNNIANRLSQKGVSETQIQKIFCKNVEGFFGI